MKTRIPLTRERRLIIQRLGRSKYRLVWEVGATGRTVSASELCFKRAREAFLYALNARMGMAATESWRNKRKA